jgi:hypothetical protein
MVKLLAVVTIGVAVLAVQPVGASVAKPTPEAVQAWAAKPQQYRTHYQERAVNNPVKAIHYLDGLYTAMVKRLAIDDKDAAYENADEGSQSILDVRRLLTHSPDRTLNKLIDKALSQLADVFDEINDDFASAGQGAARSNRLWAQVEAKLTSYGVETGEPWALSTATEQVSIPATSVVSGDPTTSSEVDVTSAPARLDGLAGQDP